MAGYPAAGETPAVAVPHSATLEAIVLRAHDVGEADRFCILLTKERGRIAARARAVRKPKSRMGGSLLPLEHVHADIVEHDAGFLITAAVRIGRPVPRNVRSFLSAMQGIEWILALVQDGEPLPEVFDLACTFLRHCALHPQDAVLPFSIRLLQMLGLLPLPMQEPFFTRLTNTERAYIGACTTEDWEHLPDMTLAQRNCLTDLTLTIAGEHGTRTPRTFDFPASFPSPLLSPLPAR